MITSWHQHFGRTYIHKRAQKRAKEVKISQGNGWNQHQPFRKSSEYIQNHRGGPAMCSNPFHISSCHILLHGSHGPVLSHAAVQWPSWGFLVHCPWDVSRVNAAARPSPRQRPSGFRSLGRRGFRKFHGSFAMFNSLVILRSYLIISEHAYTHTQHVHYILYVYIYIIYIYTLLGCNLLMS